MEQLSAFIQKKHFKVWLLAFLAVLMILMLGLIVWLLFTKTDSALTPTDPIEFTGSGGSDKKPKLSTENVVTGKDKIWDLDFLPGQEIIYSERTGKLNVIRNNKSSLIDSLEDVRAQGEGGLLGLAVDPDFKANRFIYTCFNSNRSGMDVRVVRWKLNETYKLEDRSDIVTGMPAADSGRHSGCQLEFGLDGYLWIGTGDAAMGVNPQDPRSLGGKILRVDRNGKAVEGNLGGNFDSRIYSYGHRNTQGIAFMNRASDGISGISVEHGSTVDDEVNPLIKGNFGWAPKADGYSELNVPMTDKKRFKDAVSAFWSSGFPTQAPSGATFVYGDEWGAWNGYLFVSMLKAQHLKVLKWNATKTKLVEETRLFQDKFGRLRAAKQGPDGLLYIATDNSSNNKIIKISPRL